MHDPRLAALADQLVSYSVDVQPGEKIYLEIKGVEALALGRELVRAATQRGAVPFWYYNDEDLARPFVRHAGEAQFEAWGAFHRGIMEQVDAYIAVRGSANPFDFGDVDPERMKWHDLAYWQQVHLGVRLKKKWCVLRYPNPSMAVLAQQPTEAFADFYFKVCLLDYAPPVAGHGPPQGAARADRPGRAARARHRADVQHQGHPRRQVRRPPQHPRRRDLHRAGARLDGGRDHLQRAEHEQGHAVPQHPLRRDEGAHRRGDLRRRRRRS